LTDTTVPVVEICRGGMGDVAIGRTLGRLGVAAYLVAQEGVHTPVSSSRFWAEKLRWDFKAPEGESVQFLLALGARLRAEHGARPLLLTTADWVAIFIERHARELRESFVFPEPLQPVIHALANKWDMHLLATEHDVPTPVTVRPTSHNDVETFLQTNGLPIVVKPADPFLGERRSPYIVQSAEDLLEHIERETADGPLNVVLQEYVPGGVDTIWMCNGYFGSTPAQTVIFTGKKLRQTSPTGIASLAVCLPNEAVREQTRRFMEGIGYRGCVGIGYRHDERDGLYKLLDVNARVSGIFRLFAGTHGIDVVRACYLDLTGQEVPATALRPGRKWMFEDDAVASLHAIRARRLGVAEWLRSLRGVRELQWLAPDDPAPFLVWFRDGIRRRADAVTTGARRALRRRR
jgi:predicted ATP-grasp superfamily ATP-dependent carboligase